MCDTVKSIEEFWNRERELDGKAPRCIPCEKSYIRKFRPNQRFARWRSQLKKRGLTPEAYWELWEEQHGVCATCGCPETDVQSGVLKPLAVDHDHASGITRGLLCGRCNKSLGLAREDPAVLRAMIAYLNKHTRLREALEEELGTVS